MHLIRGNLNCIEFDQWDQVLGYCNDSDELLDFITARNLMIRSVYTPADWLVGWVVLEISTAPHI
jgi:hypothetical protein